MHATSYEKIRCFRDVYLEASPASAVIVLDVGSHSYDEQGSYRSLFPLPRYQFVGLDLVPGPNVDVVPHDPYSWEELATDSIDAVVSGQTFEHNPFFWVTMAEVARVLRPGGVVAVVAPSAGDVHRFPLDCWRFYPDAWLAVCAFVGLEVVESYVEARTNRKMTDGLMWRDSFVVARKPVLTGRARDDHAQRLEKIVATRCPSPVPVAPESLIGPAISAYERSQERSRREVLWYRARRKMAGLSRRATQAWRRG